MDEIEREIKKVQLQRERLALERELARKSALEWTGKGVHALTGAAAGTAKGLRTLFRAFARQWKLMLLLAIVSATAVAGVAWQERKQQERLAAEQYAFVKKKCDGVVSQPSSCGVPDASFQDKLVCMQERNEDLVCRLGAMAEFGRMREK